MKTPFQRRLRRIDTQTDHADHQRSTVVDERDERDGRDDGPSDASGPGRFVHSPDRDDTPNRPDRGPARQADSHVESSHDDEVAQSAPGDGTGSDRRFDGGAQPVAHGDRGRQVDPPSTAGGRRHDPAPSAAAAADRETGLGNEDTHRVAAAPGTRDPDASAPTIVPDSHPDASGGRALLRAPRLAPLAAAGGWAAAWGVAVVALACLAAAGIATGLGFGIADGGAGVDDGVSAGTWMAIALAGGFLGGGYVAARMARSAAMAHGVTAWLFAVLATAADGIIADRRGSESVLETLGLPSWSAEAYSGADLVVPLVLFSTASLVGVLVGAGLGAAANRRERSPMRQI